MIKITTKQNKTNNCLIVEKKEMAMEEEPTNRRIEALAVPSKIAKAIK
jgi:hypothetical protein